jgi:phenylacetic acid degradation operon negative regulatory protein
MLTRPLAGDSRLFLWYLAFDLTEAAAGGAIALARRFTRKERWRRQLAKLEAGGLIRSRGEGPLDGRVVQLTEIGRDVLWGGVDPEVRWRRRWDGVWRMVLFDVPQSRASLRVNLCRKLRRLRFGWLQNSVWLSPDSVSDLRQTLRREKVSVESMLFMEGRPAGGEDDAELVTGAWDFERLARLHADYLKLLRAKPPVSRSLQSGRWPTWLATEDRAWRAIIRHDPLLPSVLLPPSYAGRDVWAARCEMLRSAAESMRAFVGRDG